MEKNTTLVLHTGKLLHNNKHIMISRQNHSIFEKKLD
jgi:hypothetical protein